MSEQEDQHVSAPPSPLTDEAHINTDLSVDHEPAPASQPDDLPSTDAVETAAEGDEEGHGKEEEEDTTVVSLAEGENGHAVAGTSASIPAPPASDEDNDAAAPLGEEPGAEETVSRPDTTSIEDVPESDDVDGAVAVGDEAHGNVGTVTDADVEEGDTELPASSPPPPGDKRTEDVGDEGAGEGEGGEGETVEDAQDVEEDPTPAEDEDAPTPRDSEDVGEEGDQNTSPDDLGSLAAAADGDSSPTAVDGGERGGDADAVDPNSPPPRSAADELFLKTGLRSRLDEWERKRYRGGFRDRRTDIEYFHADTQTPTPQDIKARSAPLRFTRETQTKFIRNRVTQDYRESSTQMTKRGCYVATSTDSLLKPRPYTTADDHEAWVISRVVVLQCWMRSVRARRRVRRLREERDARTRALIEKERRRRELSDRKRRREIESRLHPKSNKDFEVLYNGLETWRLQETVKINASGYSEPARLAALADLLDQEAALIQKIDRLQITANEENRERKIVRLLDAMSSSKRWTVAKLGTVHVDTPNTIRARELKDLYHALNVPLVSVDERLQILLHVKYTVKEFDCNLTREVVELIDREGDLVSRGREAKSMEGLRKRISNLFLQFIQTPEFNPEAALYQKFPDAGQSWKRDQAVYYCRSCTRYLSSTEFYLSTTLTHLGKCKSCTTDANLAVSRTDDSVYSDLLRLLRLQESQRRARSGVPKDPHYNAMSLLQESDARYIVETLWNRQSAVSGSRSVESLVLTRWNPDLELSPWNCILLTKPEAATHDRASVPEDQYSEEFVRKIQQKHRAARKHFAQLPAMEKYLRRAYVENGGGKMVPVATTQQPPPQLPTAMAGGDRDFEEE